MINAIFLFRLLLFFIPFTTFGQKQITTSQIKKIVDAHGIDSIIHLAGPEIYKIDTGLALSIVENCKDIKNYIQYGYFSEIGKRIRSNSISVATLRTLQAFRTGHPLFGTVIDDEFIHVLAFQKDTSILQSLTSEFRFWERSADSINKLLPPPVKLFFKRFSGPYPIERRYWNYRLNSYKIALGLHELEGGRFWLDKANQLKRFVYNLKHVGLTNYKAVNFTNRYDTLSLRRSYDLINDIAFDAEPALQELSRYSGYSCSASLITNNKSALYYITCHGFMKCSTGKTIRIELIAPDKLKIEIISLWIT